MAKEVNWPWRAKQHKAPLMSAGSRDVWRGVQHMHHSVNASMGMSAAPAFLNEGVLV